MAHGVYFFTLCSMRHALCDKGGSLGPMPRYTSHDNVKSGVPLGGIGAGKMEIMPNGSINFITFQNNWSVPLNGGAGGILGFHFGIFT